MFFQTVLVTALAATALATPAPFPSGTTSAVTVPAMSVAECKTHLNAQAAKKALFWSNVGGAARKATTDSKNYPYLSGYKIMGQLWTPGTYPTTYQAQWTAAQKAGKTGTQTWEQADDKFWNDCSQAMAQLAEGVVYLMMPGTDGSTGLNWGDRATSHWAMHEFPILCRSTAVTNLWRLSAASTTYKEDLTAAMMALRNTNKCPALASETAQIGDETAM